MTDDKAFEAAKEYFDTLKKFDMMNPNVKKSAYDRWKVLVKGEKLHCLLDYLIDAVFHYLDQKCLDEKEKAECNTQH